MIHKTLTYVTLDEFAEAMGFDADVLRDTLDQKGVTWGGDCGEQAFLTIARLCQLCECPSYPPEPLDPSDFVRLDS